MLEIAEICVENSCDSRLFRSLKRRLWTFTRVSAISEAGNRISEEEEDFRRNIPLAYGKKKPNPYVSWTKAGIKANFHAFEAHFVQFSKL